MHCQTWRVIVSHFNCSSASIGIESCQKDDFILTIEWQRLLSVFDDPCSTNSTGIHRTTVQFYRREAFEEEKGRERRSRELWQPSCSPARPYPIYLPCTRPDADQLSKCSCRATTCFSSVCEKLECRKFGFVSLSRRVLLFRINGSITVQAIPNADSSMESWPFPPATSRTFSCWSATSTCSSSQRQKIFARRPFARGFAVWRDDRTLITGG